MYFLEKINDEVNLYVCCVGWLGEDCGIESGSDWFWSGVDIYWNNKLSIY